MSDVMERMRVLTQRVQLGGPTKAREKHLVRNKMLPRDRITAVKKHLRAQAIAQENRLP
jgi:3-methylcrotonyl-CoA carboxylase beta subunit